MSELTKLIEKYQHAYNVSYRLGIKNHYKYYAQKILFLKQCEINILKQNRDRLLELSVTYAILKRLDIPFTIENDIIYVSKHTA